MRKIFLSLGLFFTFQVCTSGQNPLFDPPLSERIASYDISVELDTAEHSLRGNEILHWKNPSNDLITELQFHLYLNAFANDSSTFMKESRGSFRMGRRFNEKVWGSIKIHSMKIVGGEELTSRIEYYQPDDSNKFDRSVIRVPLSKPIKPQEQIDIQIEFTSVLPNLFSRTGFAKDFYLVGQWFPKIGVYEKAGQRYATKGGWNCHQFHARSEFYADFGVYNVELIVPKGFKVGATGQLEYEKTNEDGTKYLVFHAEDVIDFAWVASPDLIVLERKHKHVNIKLLVPPNHERFKNKFFESTIHAIDYLEKHIGNYPYPYLTIVDPPFYATGASGMEYPTFFTSLSASGISDLTRLSEETTIHEFVHNYFMALVASNEFEEPWLDEGITQYFETRIMDEVYGENSSKIDILGYQRGDFENARFSYTNMRNPSISDNSPFAWQYPRGSYGVLTYNKTSVWLKTLEGLIGQKVINEIFKTYFDEWKFKHPSGKDFIAVVNKIVKKNYGVKYGENMNWFFDQVLYGTEVCDYKIDRIRNNFINRNSINVTRIDSQNTKMNDRMYDSEVVVYRVGELKIPIEVLIHFNNGEEILETWDGKDRFHSFKYRTRNRVIWAKVDPDFKIKLDINLENNSLTTEPEVSVINKYAIKALFWIENFMLSIGVLF